MYRFEAILVPALFYISFCYLNYFLFTPKLFITGRYLLFIIVCAACLGLTITLPSVISVSLHSFPPAFIEGPFPGFLFQSVLPDFETSSLLNTMYHRPGGWYYFFRPEFSYTIIVFLFILTLSSGIRIIQEWQQTEKERVNAELAFLKAQINPHFLFNTLNNIYSMAVIRDEKTPSAIEKFSNLMRFVLYETQHDFVPLTRKIEYIDTYVELQKMRLSEMVTVNYEKTGNPGGLQIAPLIMMPFIENAFKFGVSTERASAITIRIDVQDGEWLHFYAGNTRNPLLEKDNTSSLVGIENTVKRLELIYPGKHTLNIDESGKEFVVELNLHLK